MQRRKRPLLAKRRDFIFRLGALAGSGMSVTASALGQAIKPKPPPKPLARPQRSLQPFATRVQIGETSLDGPTWLLASRSLQFPWRQRGGDWIDANDAQNGAIPHATLAITGINPAPIDVTSIVKRLQVANTGILLHMAGGGTPPAIMSRQSSIPPRLSIMTDQGQFDCPCVANCWIDPTSNQTLSGDLSAGGILRPSAMLKFDLGAAKGMLKSASLTLALSRWYGPATIAVDYLDMPLLVTDPARQLGGARGGIAATVVSDRDLTTHPDVIFYSECTSEADIKAKWSSVSPNYPNGQVCINPQFIQWPEVGLTALRMESQWTGFTIPGDTGSSILTWREYASGKMPRALPGTYQELYTRYLMKIDPDVIVGMNELGVKLPGFESASNVSPPGDWSYRMEHSTPSTVNGNVFRLVVYAYDVANGTNNNTFLGNTGRRTSVCMRAGQLYSIEQHVKLNTISTTPDGTVTASADGVIEIFVDGVLVYADYAAVITKKPQSGITNIPFANFYHGGTGVPKAPIHYEFSGIATSTKYIGPPKRNSAKTRSWPAWRRSIAPGQVSTIPGSSLAVLMPHNANAINAWTGLAAGPDAWYSAANGGHGDSSDNGVYSITLAEDAPRWRVSHPSSSRDSIPSQAQAAAGRLEYYFDGRPAARHSYYSPQVIVARNRVMLFYCSAAWGDGNASDPIVDGFHLDENEWDAQGAWSRGLVRDTIAQCVAKHPDTEDVYCAMNGEFAKWMQMTGEWSALSPKPNVQLQFCGSLIDAVRNRWIFSSGKSLSFIDLATLAYTKMPLNGIPSDPNFGDYSNIVHDTSSDNYVVCCTDGRVYRIDPDSALAVKIAQLPPARNGVQNRFAYFEALGGIAYYPEFSSDILFLATA